MLRLSDDTIRRQIKEGTLQAIRIGTTPTGRAQYRIPSQAIQQILTPETSESAVKDPFEPLREVFEQLSEEERETLLTEAVSWARERIPASSAPRTPPLTQKELQERFGQSPFLRRRNS